MLEVLRASPIFLMMAMLLAACGGSSNGGETSSNEARAANTVTSLEYYRHTKPIIDSRCVTCHHDAGQGPFSLTSYSEVAGKKSALAYVLETETMPPVGFSKLTDSERTLLLQWIEEGAKQGERQLTLPDSPYTYYSHAKDVIERKCVNCHSPGQIAPFSLTNFDSVHAVRAAIKHQLNAGTMPPWPPTNNYLPLKDNRSLTDEESAILSSWLDAGAPMGNPNDYVSVVENAPQIEYNFTLQTNEPYTPVMRPDEYRCLMIDWPLDHTVFVDAVNVVPDAKAQVHHVFAVIVNPEAVPIYEAADGADGKPGFPCLGLAAPLGALLPPRTLSVWAPGSNPSAFPDGTGIRVEPGSKLALQIHYNTTSSEPVPDRSSLQVRYVEEVEREAITLFFQDFAWLAPGGMPIPANDPNVTISYTGSLAMSLMLSGAADIGLGLDESFSVHSAFLHQHVLGQSNSIELIQEDGTEVMLLEIRDWDFNWQDDYLFEEEVVVGPKDQFRLTCSWDNSAANQQFIDGKQIAPQYVEFGDGTTDEMCLNFFYVTRTASGDADTKSSIAPTVAFHKPKHLQEFSPGDYVPIEVLANAFKLQEPNSSHEQHGHDAVIEGGGTHTHRSGHYHLYLDSEDDNAEHLTNWDSSTFYKLPDDILPGRHTLRVSLRNGEHEPIGVEDRVDFVVADSAASSHLVVESLVDVSKWQQHESSLDSLRNHRPANVSCPENSWYEEDGALEVETGYCNYFSVAQPSQAAVSKGDNLHLVLWHGQLNFEEPAEAHVAISIGGDLVWEDYIEIPNRGYVYDVTVPSTINAMPGDTIEFHLHNHGYNTWTLLTLEVER